MKYFDYTATTPVNKDILDTYIKTSNDFFANTTSLHKLGQMSNFLYEKAVHEMQMILRVPNHRIVYTSNATEANNLAILGLVKRHARGRIITTKIEHPSVFEVFKSLEDRFDVVYLNINQAGEIDLNELSLALNQETILVSIMWVNNIIGSVQPIKKIIEIVKKFPKAKLHVDAVQGLCKIVNDFNFCDLDIFTFSLHKIYGPKGIGGFIYKKDLLIDNILFGSSAQFGLKPGTIDLSLIICAVKTFKMFYPETDRNYLKVSEKFNYLINNLAEIDCLFNTPKNSLNPYILNIYLPSFQGEVIVRALEKDEIYLSTGSACSSKFKKPEKTILALTNDQIRALNSLRISLSPLTTNQEIDYLIKALKALK